MQKQPKPADAEEREKRRMDALVDEALKETFPASDPSAMTIVEGVKIGARPKGKHRNGAGQK